MTGKHHCNSYFREAAAMVAKISGRTMRNRVLTQHQS